MKRTGTIAAAALIAGTAIFAPRQGTFSAHRAPASESQTRETGIRQTRTKNASRAAGKEKIPGQDDLESTLRTFLDAYGGDRTLGNVRVVFAFAPDPVHTHLALAFDREMVAIQEAAQDDGFLYDSSWLPWDAEEQTYVLLADETQALDDEERKDSLPGLLLFRRGTAQANAASGGLAVFIIGENPTHGIEEEQLDEALQFAKKHLVDLDSGQMLILGPNYSGSLASLESYLRRKIKDATSKAAPTGKVEIFSGNVSGEDAVKAFVNHFSGTGVHFSSFQHSEAEKMRHTLCYLNGVGIPNANIAVLAEDETTYGESWPGGDESATNNKPNYFEKSGREAESDRPLYLPYPRDISALRSAYKEQSIFSSAKATENTPGPRIALSSDLGSDEKDVRNEGDTVRTYSGEQNSLSEEAVMDGIISVMHAHGIEAVILKSTNTLDQLFLSRFLRKNYSRARIVTFGADQLFARPADLSDFYGDLAVSTYPLLPRQMDWTAKAAGAKSQIRQFASDQAEGDYTAARFLFSDDFRSERDLPLLNPPLEYLAPWFAKTEAHQPAIYISAVGRGGYWPVVIYPPELDQANVFLPEMAKKDTSAEHPKRNIRLPASWKYCLVLCTLMALVHAHAAAVGRPLHPVRWFSTFYPSQNWRYPLLMLPGTGIITFAFAVLLWRVNILAPYLSATDKYLWLGAAWAVPILFTLWTAPVLLIRFMRFTHRSWELIKSNGPSILVRADLGSLAGAVLLGIICFFGCHIATFSDPVRIAAAYRSVHLSNGLSPAPPALLLLLAFYLWLLHSVYGLALLRSTRPRLPGSEQLHKCALEAGINPERLKPVSDEAEEQIVDAARPLPSVVIAYLPAIPIILLAMIFTFGSGGTIRTLEEHGFQIGFDLLLMSAAVLLVTEAAQFVYVWARLRKLLNALARLNLRRSFTQIREYDWRSMWSLSGTAGQKQMMVARQTELVSLLYKTLSSSHKSGWRKVAEDIRSDVNACVAFSLECPEPDPELRAFGVNWEKRGQQMRFASVAGRLLTELQILWDPRSEVRPERTHRLLWRILRLGTKSRPAEKKEAAKEPCPPAAPSENRFASEEAEVCALPPEVRLAEHFVCLLYVSFIENIQARMRTLARSMVCIFSTTALSIAVYPFTPRPVLTGFALLLLLVLALSAASVYASMDKNEILNRIVNGDPTRLEGSFWIKMAQFLAAPLLGVLTTEFPSIAGSLFSWLHPFLDSK